MCVCVCVCGGGHYEWDSSAVLIYSERRSNVLLPWRENIVGEYIAIGSGEERKIPAANLAASSSALGNSRLPQVFHFGAPRARKSEISNRQNGKMPIRDTVGQRRKYQSQF